MKILPQIYTNCSQILQIFNSRLLFVLTHCKEFTFSFTLVGWLHKNSFFLLLISRKIPWKIPWKLPPRCCCLWIKSAEMNIYNRKRPAGTSELQRGCTSEAENYGRGTLRGQMQAAASLYPATGVISIYCLSCI